MLYKKILVAVDSKASFFAGADYAFALAHQLKAIVVLLYVADKTKEVTNADRGITTRQSIAGSAG